MATTHRGKPLFDNRVEYPLPKETGVRDYIFYFVPANDGYGEGARAFLNKFYPNHIKREPKSLEGLISFLHNEVTERRVQHIREIVIVTHGNPQGLIFPILDSVNDTDLKVFKYLTDFSLACLQVDFWDKKLQSFYEKRKKVVSHLRNDSWITIRACNFGKSKRGLYAVYSFFGGKANVYAPTEYQFFGTHPVKTGMRLENDLEVHQHFVKQRFVTKDVHTTERKDAVVNALTDPGRFAEPFELASMSTPNSNASAPYENLVKSLNARKLDDPLLRAKFLEQNLEFSPRAKVLVFSRNNSWRIVDFIRHKSFRGKIERFEVQYQIRKIVGASGETNPNISTLWAQAKIIVPSTMKSLPIQLFFYESENDLFKGKLFTLGFYVGEIKKRSSEDPDTENPKKDSFNAIVSTLLTNRPEGNTFSNTSGVDIRADFDREEGIVLSAQAKIKVVSITDRAGKATNENNQPFINLPANELIANDGLERLKIEWAIADPTNQKLYLIKLEHLATPEGKPVHVLSVYESIDEAYAHELMSHLGADPDTPGPELPAYLDRLTLDELVDLIDYLRSPYKPANIPYIYHAQQAIRRKKNYLKWFIERNPGFAEAPLFHDPYSMLSLSEREDKREVIYDFDFLNFWNEVKASSPSSTEFEEDLFEEESLPTALRIPLEDIVNRNLVVDLDEDSPYSSIDELRELEKPGLERFFSTEKSIFDPPEDEEDISCEEFAAVIAAWKEVQNLEPAEIKKLLEVKKTPSGKGFLDVLGKLKDPYSFLKDMGKLTELIDLPPFPSIEEGVKLILKKTPFLARIAVLQTILEIDFVFTVPIGMWLQFLEDQQNARDAWERIGKLTAYRQWLQELIDLTFTRESDFPSELNINIFTRPKKYPNMEYYLGRFSLESRDPRIIFAPDRVKQGFDKGAKAIEAAGKEILDYAEEAVAESLRAWDFDSCKIQVLVDAGILDITRLKAHVVRHAAQTLLKKLPRVP